MSDKIINKIYSSSIFLLLKYLKYILIIFIGFILLFYFENFLTFKFGEKIFYTFFGFYTIICFIFLYLYFLKLKISNIILSNNDKKIIFIDGTLIKYKTIEIKITDIEQISIKKVGLLSKYYNFGTIIIKTKNQIYNFDYIKNPKQLLEEIKNFN